MSVKYIIKFGSCLLSGTVIIGGLLVSSAFAWSSGPPAYRTGAPNDDGTCRDSGCHSSFILNSGDAKFSITGPSFYVPGETIKLKISFKDDSGSLHGFEMTALDSNNNRVGKFKSIGNTTQVVPPNDFRGLDEEDENKYIEHTVAGNQRKKWKVKWKASSDASGVVTFYAAGNDANGNGSQSGDHIYTTTLEINATSTASMK